jgi:DNA-binding NtrC family response regulator
MSEDRKTQVLILDDEPIVWKRLKPAMEKAGYEVEAFSQSSHAMRRVQEKEFDIVVTDLKMEGIDGMAFMTEVKKRSPRTEVIVITGFATMETAKESFQKGVFDFLAKPFKRGELLEIVKKAEAKVRQQQER